MTHSQLGSSARLPLRSIGDLILVDPLSAVTLRDIRPRSSILEPYRYDTWRAHFRNVAFILLIPDCLNLDFFTLPEVGFDQLRWNLGWLLNPLPEIVLFVFEKAILCLGLVAVELSGFTGQIKRIIMIFLRFCLDARFIENVDRELNSAALAWIEQPIVFNETPQGVLNFKRFGERSTRKWALVIGLC